MISVLSGFWLVVFSYGSGGVVIPNQYSTYEACMKAMAAIPPAGKVTHMCIPSDWTVE